MTKPVKPKAKKEYKCTFTGCKHVFSTSSHRARHVHSIHEKIRHKCDHCGAEYTRKDKLKQHFINKPDCGFKPPNQTISDEKTTQQKIDNEFDRLAKSIEDILLEKQPVAPPPSPTPETDIKKTKKEKKQQSKNKRKRRGPPHEVAIYTREGMMSIMN